MNGYRGSFQGVKLTTLPPPICRPRPEGENLPLADMNYTVSSNFQVTENNEI